MTAGPFVRACERRSAVVAGLVALAARLVVVAWAGSRFPPAADGEYYHALAVRLAEGAGYTWRWPDGAVTAAAHYPVGYPALLAIGYRAFGPTPLWGMVLGAAIGALGASAAARLARPFGGRASVVAGLFVALHPALVSYTPALMTEGVAGSLLLVAAAVAMQREVAGGSMASPLPLGGMRLAAAGLLMGITTLVRPQLVVLAPFIGVFATAGAKTSRRIGAAGIVSLAALAVVLPWTARNCLEMRSCALVSVNGGWNLLIGAQTTTGAWQEVVVPEPCRTIWDEAGKDACFAREARRALSADPGGALARVPAKLGVTFDYFGGGAWYLHESNPRAFDDRAKRALGAVDAVSSRLLLVLALVAMARHHRDRRLRIGRTDWRAAAAAVLLAIGIVSALSRYGAAAYLTLVGLVAVARPPRLALALPLWVCAAVIASVALTHAVFFGAGRYGLVATPFVAVLAALAVSRREAGLEAESPGS